MKNLAQFKQYLKTNIGTAQIESKIYDRNTRFLKFHNKPGPVHRVQSESFSVLRDGKESYINFHKSGNWKFTPGTNIVLFSFVGNFEAPDMEFIIHTNN